MSQGAAALDSQTRHGARDVVVREIEILQLVDTKKEVFGEETCYVIESKIDIFKIWAV